MILTYVVEHLNELMNEHLYVKSKSTFSLNYLLKNTK